MALESQNNGIDFPNNRFETFHSSKIFNRTLMENQELIVFIIRVGKSLAGVQNHESHGQNFKKENFRNYNNC